MEIISHPLCPHAQRLVMIGLLADQRPGRDYKLTYLPYETLMQQAPRYSPSGQLPVLRIDDRLVSDNTDAIAEFMDATLALGLLPQEPLAVLKMRDGERRVATALDALRGVFTARDRVGLDAAYQTLFDALEPIEARLDGSVDPATLGHLGDIALASMGSLIAQYAALRDHERWVALPRVKARLVAASTTRVVVEAKCPDYAEAFSAFFRMTGSNFPTLVDAA